MLCAGPCSETARQLDHIALGGAALLLRYAESRQAVDFTTAALIFDVILLRGPRPCSEGCLSHRTPDRAT